MLKNNGFHNRHSPIYRLIAALSLDFTSGRLDPRITFSRTTNATLTNSAGLIANAPMNLLTFSEQFDNVSWFKSQVGAGVIPVVTANTSAAPDGTLTADTVVFVAPASGDQSILNKTPPTSAGTYTGTIYVKATGAGDVGKIIAFRHVLTGAYTLITLTSAWQRATATEVRGSDNFELNLRPAVGASSGTVSVQVWGAQLELGSTATTYNPTTVKNLLGYTENFDNAAWTKSNASISATKVDDIYGQPFAQQVTASASNGTVLSTYTAVASTPYTFSIWMKRVAGAGNIDISADGTTWATQTLTTEWQRFSVTVSPTAGSKTPGVRIATSGDSIYIFGAQLSDSASVDPYVYQPVAAPSSVAYYGPRFDYDPVTLAPKGLLIEEQRTNLLTYSQDFMQISAWPFVENVTQTGNSTVAPDGTNTGTSFVPTTTAGVHRTRQSYTTIAGGVYTASIYAKANGYKYLFIQNSGSSAKSCFDLSTGTITSITAGTAIITDAGNGWYRCTVTGTAPSSGSVLVLYQVNVASSVAADDTTSGNGTSGIFIWGAQLEAGAFATSYIPTVASQVTRAADNASMIGNNFARWYNQTEGTVYAQVVDSSNYTGAPGWSAALAIDDNIAGYGNISLIRGGAAVAVVSATVSTGWTSPLGTAYKIALGLKGGNFSYAKNGVLDTAQASPANTPLNQTQISIGYLKTTGSSYLNGHISRIAYYPRRLANTELQGITS